MACPQSPTFVALWMVSEKPHRKCRLMLMEGCLFNGYILPWATHLRVQGLWRQWHDVIRRWLKSIDEVEWIKMNRWTWKIEMKVATKVAAIHILYQIKLKAKCDSYHCDSWDALGISHHRIGTCRSPLLSVAIWHAPFGRPSRCIILRSCTFCFPDDWFCALSVYIENSSSYSASHTALYMHCQNTDGFLSFPSYCLADLA
jgi:hypothetical protein